MVCIANQSASYHVAASRQDISLIAPIFIREILDCPIADNRVSLLGVDGGSTADFPTDGLQAAKSGNSSHKDVYRKAAVRSLK
jgi:hypothetical protein